MTFGKIGARKLVGLPYDFVSGIRSDGIAYCALPGRVDASGGAVWVDFTVTEDYGPQNCHLFGSHGATSGGTQDIFVLNMTSNNVNGLYCFGVYSDGTTGLQFAANERYVLETGNNSCGTWARLNGVSVFRQNLGTPQYNGGRFLVFRASNRTGDLDEPQVNVSPSWVLIHRMKVWFGNRLVADLLPCRLRATGEACFSNAVDGTMVKNIAGGSLIAVV